VSDTEALKRLSLRKEQREDDTEKAIEKRIKLFHNLTESVLSYYRKKGILIEVDGERSIEEIHQDIMEQLGGRSRG
jgi:adenylate kinase